jgi:hypothetical protein
MTVGRERDASPEVRGDGGPWKPQTLSFSISSILIDFFIILSFLQGFVNWKRNIVNHKNLDRTSGSGIMQLSFFPNHEYLFLAIKSYTGSRTHNGRYFEYARYLIGPFSFDIIRNAASDLK